MRSVYLSLFLGSLLFISGVIMIFGDSIHLKDNMVSYIGSYREEIGVENIKNNIYLGLSAKTRACYLDIKEQRNHDGAFEWIKFFRKTYVMGENIGIGIRDEKILFDKFLESPTHRAVIINPDFKYVGVGRCGKYLVQHFSGS